MEDPAYSTVYMQAHERTAMTTTLHPLKVWERLVDDVYSILKQTHLEHLRTSIISTINGERTHFHHINNLHLNIKFTMEE